MRVLIVGLLLGAMSLTSLLPGMVGQSASGLKASGKTQGSTTRAALENMTRTLLEKAHALEERGRIDMAAQTWRQVLLADPMNVQALGGLARAAKLSGNTALAGGYLDRLRAIDPSDPGISRAEGMGSEVERDGKLLRAGKLAQQGHYGQAMAIYREAYGANPPPGDAALTYYETEAATEEGRSHAIAGMRALVKSHNEPRYEVTLGRILTYSPKTRAEGRRLLASHLEDAEAQEALRRSLLWDAQNPASAAEIRQYLTSHPDAELAAALPAMQPRSGDVGAGPTAGANAAMDARQRAGTAMNAARSAANRAAYQALNQNHLEDAESQFELILAGRPGDADALAGLGYVRMQQQNFAGAISFLAEAKQDGVKDPGINAALATSHFWYTMGEGAALLKESDLAGAEKQYRAALALRPQSVEALEGLGGTLLKSQQPAAAAGYFAQYVKLKPRAAHAWRGLMLAQEGAGDPAAALASERTMPAMVRAELETDPLYLGALATAYRALGKEADSQRVLQAALDLPLTADISSLDTETKLQYAGLLQAALHEDQASGLYREVLLKDPENTESWQGLVRIEQHEKREAQALATLESMPPVSYARAMRDPGFQVTAAALYQGQGRLEVAEEILERAIAQQVASGQRDPVAEELQLAGLYLQRRRAQQAYPIYRALLTEDPGRTEVWKGLLATLHATDRDKEALAEVQQIPTATRVQMENDVEFLQTMSAVYSRLGQTQQARIFLRRVQAHYAEQHLRAPVETDLEYAWLLYNGVEDAGLYQQLLSLGSREDLSKEQRRSVQTIWANWAVRRAGQATAGGDRPRALALLHATTVAFPDNAEVTKMVAGGYTRAGLPKQAVLIWRAQDLRAAPAAEYQAAIGAALEAGETKDAERWLRFGLERYPQDADLLILGAKFEEARGDSRRAADYYRTSLEAMPRSDAAAEMALELSRPLPGVGGGLAALLAPALNRSGGGTYDVRNQAPQAYLPAYGEPVSAPVQIERGLEDRRPGAAAYGADPSASGPVPKRPAKPVATLQSRLRDYVPQASWDGSEVRVQPRFGSVGGVEDSRWTAEAYSHESGPRGTQQVEARQQGGERGGVAEVGGRLKEPGPLTDLPMARAGSTHGLGGAAEPGVGEVQGRYVPEKVAVVKTAVSHGDGWKPVGDFRLESGSEFGATLSGAAQDVPRAGEQAGSGTQVLVPADTSRAGTRRVQAQTQSRGASGQQTPQTDRGRLPARTPARGARSATLPSAEHAESTSAAAGSMSSGASYAGLSLRGEGESLTEPPYPQAAGPSGSEPAPSDADLVARQVPPLRGTYYRGGLMPAASPLTAREQAERDLASIEASYSGWLGGTAWGRYRSGTVGLDRMTDLEATAEASATLGNGVRLSVVPRSVFLNSGALNAAQYAGVTAGVPVLGTMALNAVTVPGQQITNGVGGELQVSGSKVGVAIGYTPAEFLVHNFTGRFLFRPSRHVTFYANRAPVVETQLSYAGLRDPGSTSPVYAGNVWGGVVATGVGLRFDAGDEHAGFYLSVEGADLTGSHVLGNTKFEGSMGAYFLAHTFPGYGRVNVGASLMGMHYAYNERGLSYGLGGYFSPEAHLLASVPVTFVGRYGENFHYTIAGSAGVQSFQESSQLFFPIDQMLQSSFAATANGGLACTAAQTAAHSCAQYPTNGNTGGNYGFNAQGAYRINEHWFGGGFLLANNTNNYNTVTGGFFMRYLFRPQVVTEDYPTGLFPVEGFGPLRVP